jgi:hypothetical protein
MIVLTVEGVDFEVVACPPNEGDWYLGTYNKGEDYELYQADSVDNDNKWVLPSTGGLPHEFNECKRVIRIIEDGDDTARD